MKYTSKVLENKNIEFEITINKEQWEHALEESYNSTKHKYTVEGFRKGKAPRKVIEKNYGENVFFEEALNHAFFHAYNEILQKETDIEVVDSPKIDIKNIGDDGIVLTAEVTVRPDVKLGKYKGFNIKVEEKQVTDEHVLEQLQKVQNQNVRMVELENAEVKLGNIANIDFVGSIDGVEFDGGKAESFDLEIGSKSFIDSFEEQLIGLKAGDKKDVSVTFPATYHAEELAGKKAVFAVTINSIKEKQLPEIDDQLASEVSKHETLDEYKKEIKQNLEKQFAEEARSQLENQIIDAIVDDLQVDVPECMVEQETDAMLKDMENKLMYQGINLEQYANYLNTTIDEIRNERKQYALKSVKIKLAMQEIIKKEDIQVTDKELDDRLGELAKSMGKTLNEFKEMVTDERIGYMKNDIIVNKLLQFLVNNNSK